MLMLTVWLKSTDMAPEPCEVRMDHEPHLQMEKLRQRGTAIREEAVRPGGLSPPCIYSLETIFAAALGACPAVGLVLACPQVMAVLLRGPG